MSALFGRRVPPIPAVAGDIAVHLEKDGSTWTAPRFVAGLGRSDLSGTLQYVAADPGAPGSPARLRASLDSRRIDVAEWPAARAAAASPPIPVKDATPGAPLDAQVEWRVARVDGLPLPVSGLRTHAAWRDERLTLDPLVFVLAGGEASGRLALSAVAASLDLQLAGLHLDQLGVPALSGGLNARVALRSRGESVESMLAALAGTAEADLLEATLPAALDAKLGLDGGRWLRTVIAGRHQRSAVLCSSLRVGFDMGIGTVQRLALETDSVLLTGSGSVDLPQRRMKIAVTPHRKHLALFALDDAIRLDGALSRPSVTLARSHADAAHADGCAGRVQVGDRRVSAR